MSPGSSLSSNANTSAKFPNCHSLVGIFKPSPCSEFQTYTQFSCPYKPTLKIFHRPLSARVVVHLLCSSSTVTSSSGENCGWASRKSSSSSLNGSGCFAIGVKLCGCTVSIVTLRVPSPLWRFGFRRSNYQLGLCDFVTCFLEGSVHGVGEATELFA